MNTQGVSRRLLWPGLLVLLLLLLALPANAGPQGKKFVTDTTTSTETTTPSTGDINPTSAPVVDDDFDGLLLVAGTGEAVQVESTELSVWSDAEVLDQLNARAVHEMAQGRGMVVAVLDSGFDLKHPSIQPNLVPGGWDFVDDDPDPTDTGNGVDDDKDGWTDRGVGHGTTVAAMVLNAAPLAGILPLRVRNDEGLGHDKPLLSAIEYAVDLGVDVINLSLDDDIYDLESVRWIIAYAKKNGVFVVAAAGNDGLTYLPDWIVAEANLLVGAVDDDDVVAPFTNYSTSSNRAQMVFAPGVDLIGPMVLGDRYTRGYWSGTSFAAGIASGAAALALELHPEWDPWDVQAAIVESVVPVVLPNGKKLKKQGRLDLQLLVQR